MLTKVKWPSDMVDAERLFEILGHQVGDPSIIGQDEFEKVVNLTAAVDRARISGRIRRYTYKDTATGEVVAYGYKREDVKRIIGI